MIALAGCASPRVQAQTTPGPSFPSCTLDTSHVGVYDSPTTTCEATLAEVEALHDDKFLLLDASNGPMTGNLTIQTAANPTLFVTDSTTPATAYVQAQDTVGVVGTNTAHDLLLVTSGTERFRWDHSGACLGIGDTSCDETLEVVGTFAVSATAGGDGDRFIVDSSGAVGVNIVNPGYRVEVSASSGDGYFGISNPLGTSGDIVEVDSNGDVGINNNTPGGQLDVDGDDGKAICITTGSGTICDYGLLATAPGTCTTGEVYTDTSPAKCWCSATDTWSVIVGTSCT